MLSPCKCSNANVCVWGGGGRRETEREKQEGVTSCQVLTSQTGDKRGLSGIDLFAGQNSAFPERRPSEAHHSVRDVSVGHKI